MSFTIINGVKIDNVLANQLVRIKEDVLKRDRDKHFLVDGREGTGKSVFAMQLAKALDADFGLHKIAFNSDTFIQMIKSTDRKKGDCILLDEAFSSANVRASLSQINRAMITVATEMRQLNLFIIIVLPSFFDLDKYFAIWRSETLFHVYYNKRGFRGQYVIIPFNKKKLLYIKGRKTYNYFCVKSPYPACQFPKQYVVDEIEYRKKKAEAFRVRKKEGREIRDRKRLIMLIKFIKNTLGLSNYRVGDILGETEANIRKILKEENTLCELPTHNNNLLSNDNDED